VCAEIPGLDPKDLQVSVTEDFLTIRGEKREDTLRDETNRHLEDRGYGQFRRTIRLPSGAVPDRVEASFKNGALELTIGSAPSRELGRSRGGAPREEGVARAGRETVGPRLFSDPPARDSLGEARPPRERTGP